MNAMATHITTWHPISSRGANHAGAPPVLAAAAGAPSEATANEASENRVSESRCHTAEAHSTTAKTRGSATKSAVPGAGPMAMPASPDPVGAAAKYM